MAGPQLSEEEHEVTLTEEQPAVSKETGPVERVRLGKEQVSAEEQVSGQVRTEQIEVEGENGSQRRSR